MVNMVKPKVATVKSNNRRELLNPEIGMTARFTGDYYRKVTNITTDRIKYEDWCSRGNGIPFSGHSTHSEWQSAINGEFFVETKINAKK